MKEYVLELAKQILNIDSPSGYCKKVIDFCQKEAKSMGYYTCLNEKGNLQIYVN